MKNWTVQENAVLVYVTGILMREGEDHDYTWELRGNQLLLRFHRALLHNDFVTVVDLPGMSTLTVDDVPLSGVYVMPDWYRLPRGGTGGA